MHPEFWRQKWERNEIAFHDSEFNSLLLKHFDKLSLNKGSRVFIPLCGKTRDISWFLRNGFRVAGAELSGLAVDQLFEELGVKPKKSPAGALVRHSAGNIDIFQGNIFDLTGSDLGPVQAVYDRAALVALPEAMRVEYSRHILDITGNAPQLLICYAYDQALMDGPPFSISADEVRKHYGGTHEPILVETRMVPGGLRGQIPAGENAWILKPK